MHTYNADCILNKIRVGSDAKCQYDINVIKFNFLCIGLSAITILINFIALYKSIVSADFISFRRMPEMAVKKKMT